MIIIVIIGLMIAGGIVGNLIYKKEDRFGIPELNVNVLVGVLVGFVLGCVIYILFIGIFYEPVIYEVQLQEIDNSGLYVTQSFSENNNKVYNIQPTSEDKISFTDEQCIIHFRDVETPYAIITEQNETIKFWCLIVERNYEIYLNDESQME